MATPPKSPEFYTENRERYRQLPSKELPICIISLQPGDSVTEAIYEGIRLVMDMPDASEEDIMSSIDQTKRQDFRWTTEKSANKDILESRFPIRIGGEIRSARVFYEKDPITHERRVIVEDTDRFVDSLNAHDSHELGHSAQMATTGLALINRIRELLEEGKTVDDRMLALLGSAVENIEGGIRYLNTYRLLRFRDKSESAQIEMRLDDLVPRALKGERTTDELNRHVFIRTDLKAPDIYIRGQVVLALEIIISNLVRNAIKHNPNMDLNIKIATTTSEDGKLYRVIVTDNGQGIPDDELPHIFEANKRGKKSMAANIDGKGMGLRIVKDMIKQNGGKIEVKSIHTEDLSHPYHGTEFIVTMPIEQAA